MDLLAENKVTLVHNPVSNMKLGSGVFPSAALLDAGCRITLGTDGCSSNNNLDMREEMKTAALLANAIIVVRNCCRRKLFIGCVT